MKHTVSARRLVVSLLSSCLLIPLAPACVEARGNSGARPIGTIVGWGTYTVDEMAVPAGALLFSGDVIATGRDSGAELSLISGAMARLEAESEVRLASTAANLDLRQGALTLRTGAGKLAR